MIAVAPVWCELDLSALSRIFSNIISNALKYSDGDFHATMKLEGFLTGFILFRQAAILLDWGCLLPECSRNEWAAGWKLITERKCFTL